MKTCTRCGETKPATTAYFGRQAQKRDGLTPHCKACSAIYDAARDKVARAARLKAERAADPARFAGYDRTKLERHRERMRPGAKARKARWIAADPERARAQWRQQNRNRYPAARVAAMERYRTDPAFNLICRIRARTRKALMSISKSEATIELLGCSPIELRAWIEVDFVDGMGWHNMAEWELDHRWPLSLFDLSDARQLHVACNYRNLQPLFRLANRSKKNKLIGAEREQFEAWKATL